MLTLLHGDNLVATYTTLLKQIKTFTGEVIRLDSKTVLSTDLETISGQASLFDDKKLVILEGWPKAALLKTVARIAENQEVVIFVDKKVDVKDFPGKALEFKDINQTTTFKLADFFIAQDFRNAYLELESLLAEKTPPELILGMLGRQIRLMIQVLDKDTQGIHPYQVQKLSRFALKWQKESLLKLLVALLHVDHQIKTGRIEAKAALFNFLIKINLP